MGSIGRPMVTNNGMSTAAPRMCMLARLNSVRMGIGGVGVKNGKNRESNRATKDIVTNTKAGRRTVLAMIRKLLRPDMTKTLMMDPVPSLAILVGVRESWSFHAPAKPDSPTEKIIEVWAMVPMAPRQGKRQH